MTAMTDKTPPYVTTFDQIKPGQLIEREWSFNGVRFRAEGIAHHLSPAGRQWLTADDGLAADCADSIDTLRVLAEPPKPPLPIEGYIEAWGVPAWGADEIHLVIAALDADGDWNGLTEDGEGRYLTPNQITRWSPVKIVPADDPAAPEADDGLRERVEALIERYRHISIPSGSGIVQALRTALTETSADA